MAVGLLYRTGYFHQRIDLSGMQHEYWIESDPTSMACVPVTDETTGERVTVTVPAGGEEVTVQVWRVERRAGAPLPARHRPLRQLTSRSLDHLSAVRGQPGRSASPSTRCSGSARCACPRALGVSPSVFHLNEGHPALAAFELLREEQALGASWDEAWATVVEQIVFTTHTPVPAGNETYGRDEVLHALGTLAAATGDPERFLATGRVDPPTIRTSRRA